MPSDGPPRPSGGLCRVAPPVSGLKVGRIVGPAIRNRDDVIDVRGPVIPSWVSVPIDRLAAHPSVALKDRETVGRHESRYGPLPAHQRPPWGHVSKCAAHNVSSPRPIEAYVPSSHGCPHSLHRTSEGRRSAAGAPERSVEGAEDGVVRTAGLCTPACRAFGPLVLPEVVPGVRGRETAVQGCCDTTVGLSSGSRLRAARTRLSAGRSDTGLPPTNVSRYRRRPAITSATACWASRAARFAVYSIPPTFTR